MFERVAEICGSDILELLEAIGEPPRIARDELYEYLEMHGGEGGKEVAQWMYTFENDKDLEKALEKMRVPKSWRSRATRETSKRIAAFRELLREGLTQAEVLGVLGRSAEDCAYVARAQEMYVDDEDEVSLDDKCMISESDDGAWVSAWVWVGDDAEMQMLKLKPLGWVDSDVEPDALHISTREFEEAIATTDGCHVSVGIYPKDNNEQVGWLRHEIQQAQDTRVV